MPISYFHGDVAPYLLAGQRYGATQAAQQSQQEAFRQAQLAEQQRQFDANLAFRQNAFAYDQQRDRRNVGLGLLNQELNFQRQAALNDMTFQRQAALNDLNFQRQASLYGIQHQFGLEDIAAQNQAMMDRNRAVQAGQIEGQLQRDQWQAALEDAQQNEEQVNEALDELSQANLSDKGKAKLQGLETQWRDLQSKRATQRPYQWSDAISQFLGQIRDARVDREIIEPLTVEKMFKSGRLWRDPETGDVWGIEVRNGEEKATLIKEAQQEKPVDYEKDAKDAKTRWTNKQKSGENYKPGSAVREPTPDEIVAEIEQHKKDMEEVARQMASKQVAIQDTGVMIKPLPKKKIPANPPVIAMENIELFMADNKTNGEYFIYNGSLYYKKGPGEAQFIPTGSMQ